MDTNLENTYFDLSSSGSFGTNKRLKQVVKTLTDNDIQDFLSTQDTYTRHKQRYGKFLRRRVTAPCRNYLFQADLIFMQKYKSVNQNYQYILSVIDVFSKYGFCIPLKNKTADEIVRGFTEIFLHYKYKPKYIQCDEGREFFNAKFQKYLSQYNITLYHNYSDFKACVVERFNRTILNRISKYFTLTGKKEYVSVLPKILQSYNSTIHRSTGTKPRAVTKYNEMDIWMYMNRDMWNVKSKRCKLKLNDRVRLCKKRGIFEKGYSPTHTTEIFEINEEIKSIPPTFKVRDLHGEVLRGIFYEKELVKVK